MKKYIVLIFATLLLLIGNAEKSHAAFAVTPKAEHTEAAAAQPVATTAPARHTKTFSERKVPQLFRMLTHPMPSPMGGHPGWPGTLSLVFSLCGLVFAFLPVLDLLSIPLLIAGIVFGAIGLNRHKYSNNGSALAGLLIGSIVLLLYILLIILIVGLLTAL